MKAFPLLAVLAFVLDAAGAGRVILPEPPPRPPAPPRPPRPPITRIVPPRNQPVELQAQSVTARIDDQIARTTVEQVFYNPNPRRVEGSFLFPAPAGAQLDGFTLQIDGKNAEAELLDAGKARRIYEDIVRSTRDPGLLEYAGRDLYRIRVFPFPPNGRRTLTISYTQVLPSDNGLVEYRAPLSVARGAAAPPRKLSLAIQLKTRAPLKSIWSPSHEVDIRRKERQATITWENADGGTERDLQLYFTSRRDEFDASLMAHRVEGEDGYFLLLLSPGQPDEKAPAIPKDVIFVLDTSGSMAGEKLEQAKRALTFCVANLNSRDRFEVLRFSTEVEPLFDGLRKASPENRRQAEGFIRMLRPQGSTAIDDALKAALSLRSEKKQRPTLIIFLTDGRPTIGVTRESEIVANVSRRNTRMTRIFCFGLGTDVNTHLLDRITEKTRAASQYVLPHEDLELKLSSFFSKIKDPVLADVSLEFPEGVRPTKMYPKALPDLFKGDQLVLVGRYRNPGKGTLILRGTVNGKEQTRGFDLKFPRSSGRHGFIPRLWATRRVGYLLDEIRLNGEKKELRDEVTALARQYGIVTPYTAYLIVEDERRNHVTENRRLLPQFESDAPVREQITTFYRSLGRAKSGSAGVAGAQSTSSLKNARSAPAATTRANLSAREALIPARPMPANTPKPKPGRRISFPARGPAVQSLPATIPPAASSGNPGDRLAEYTRQNRHLAGKTFYWNGKAWIDAAAQQLKDARPTRVRFASEEFFALCARSPEAARWLSLGRNITLVIDGTLYEIHEGIDPDNARP